MPESPDSYEQHPHLPSGYWTGFYVYYHSQERHEMLLMLDFINGNISGNGHDDVGAFTFEGHYDLTSMTCRFMKHYSTHQIDYHGQIDENGIWGKWYYVYYPGMGIDEAAFNKLMSELRQQFSGGFHIWPRNKEFSAHEMAVRKLKEEEVIKLVE
jgi:hypothetical protein